MIQQLNFRVSYQDADCSAWADRDLLAEKLQHNYVYSLKPTPAALSQPQMDEDPVRRDIRSGLRTARDCCVELIMKDNHTIGRNPRNVTRWVEMTREEMGRM